MDPDLLKRIEAAIGASETEADYIALRTELDTFISQHTAYTKADITRIQEILHKFDYGDTVGAINGEMTPGTAKALLTYTTNDSIAFRNGHIGMAFVDSAIAVAPSDSVVSFQQALAVNPYAPRIASHIATTTPIARDGSDGVDPEKAQLAIFQAAGLAPMASPVSDRLAGDAAARNRVGFTAQSGDYDVKDERLTACLSKSLDSAESIAQFQAELNARGFHCGRADGIMGANTARAGLNFIMSHPESLAQMDLKNLETLLRNASPDDLANLRERLATSPDVQNALIARMAATNDVRGQQTIAAVYGFYDPNKIDGVTGRNTRDALRQFEGLTRSTTGADVASAFTRAHADRITVADAGSGARIIPDRAAAMRFDA